MGFGVLALWFYRALLASRYARERGGLSNYYNDVIAFIEECDSDLTVVESHSDRVAMASKQTKVSITQIANRRVSVSIYHKSQSGERVLIYREFSVNLPQLDVVRALRADPKFKVWRTLDLRIFRSQK